MEKFMLRLYLEYLNLKLQYIKKNDPIQLWVNNDSLLNQERKKKIQIFDEDFRIEALILKPRNDDIINDPDFNIIKKDYLKEIYYIEKLLKLAPYNNQQKNNFEDLCWTAFAKGSCVTQSPMNYWQGNLQRMLQDDDIQKTISCEKVVDPDQSLACMDQARLPVNLKAVFNGIIKTKIEQCCNKFQIEDDPCIQYHIKAKTLNLTYLLKGENSIKDDALNWEKDIGIKYINQYNKSKDSDFMKQYIKDVEFFPLQLKIDYMFQRTIDDELETETRQNYIIVVISYLLMFVYISLSLGTFYNCVKSNFLLALVGMFYILASVMIGYSVCGFLQIKASLISLEVIPFLILAIGVDNMFLIYYSVLRVPSNDPEIKVSIGLRNIGSSIVLSTFTQILTFCSGFYIGIPALSTFCLTAIFSLLTNFVIQITVWPALLTIDLRRKQQGYLDLVPFVQTQQKVDIKFPDKNKCANFFQNIWKKVVLSKFCKFFSISLCLIGFVFAFVAFKKIPEGLDQQLATVQGGNLYNFFGDVKKYIELGPQASIIIDKADYYNEETYDILEELIELLSQRQNLANNPWLVWFRGAKVLQDFVNLDQFSAICYKGIDDKQELIADFDKLVQYYLQKDMNDDCCNKYGICGGQFYDDIIYKHGKIAYSRISFMHGPLREQKDYIQSLSEIKQIVQYFKDQNSERIKKVGLSFFPYSMWYVFFEQYEKIKGLAIQNYILSIAILFTLVAILYDWKTSIMMVILVIFISSNLWCIIWICNFLFEGLPVEINAVLLVNFIISIGISVEFCIHSIVRYRKAKGNHEEKVNKTIKEIVSVVFQGIFLTKLIGLSVLYFSEIPIFVIYYFRVFYAMILVCGFYGLIIVPQLLDLFGNLIIKQSKTRKKSINEYILDKQENVKKEQLLSQQSDIV